MAGFFGFFDYTKPGPGVEKDAPPKHPFIVFFEVFGRKFWNLVKLNMMFFIFNIPAYLCVLLASLFYFHPIQDITGSRDIISVDLIFRVIFGAFLTCIPVITVGPAQAGFSYILRNYSREEHAFIWWDFKDNALRNFKQASLVALIDFFVTIVFGISINFYIKNTSSSIFMSIALGLIILAFLIFLMMHIYIYPMLVTFKLTIRQLYKNAFIFSVIKFFSNLGILILCAVIIALSFYILPLGIVLFPLITVSLIGYILNFFAYPKLKKYMMPEEETEESQQSEESEQG